MKELFPASTIGRWVSWNSNPVLLISLSLSLSHTHTHTYTQMYLTKHGSAPGMDTVLALKEFSLVRWQMLDQ